MRKNFKLLLLSLLALSGGSKALAQKANLQENKGWQKITELPADVNKYFFVLYDHTEDLGMVMRNGENQGTNNKTMWYAENVNPESDKDALWEFVASGEYQVIVNANYPNFYLQTEMNWSASPAALMPWIFHTSDNGGGDPAWGQVEAKYELEAWTLMNVKAKDTEEKYIGPWDNTFTDNAEIAGNKKEDAVGKFDIYAITRGQYVQAAEDLSSATLENPIDISYVITDNGAELKYADRKAIDLAWTKTPGVNIQTRNDNGLANKDGRVYMESWEDGANNHTLSDRGLSQTIADLPAGVYKLTVLTDATAAGAFLYAGEDKVEMNTNIDGVATLTFKVDENSEPLEYGVKLESYQSNWIKFDKFQLYYCGKDVIDEEEIKQNLQELLVEAEKITLGFDEGEYAPYKNVAFVQAYGKAKQIAESTESVDISVYVDTYNELKSAMEVDLVKNDTEVNAVYDGTFANAVHDGAPLGWTMSNNTLGGATHSRAFVGDERLSEFNETNSGFFVRFDGYSSDAGSMYYYGKTDGYTMPLKADTYYTLSLDFANWADSGTPEAPFKVNVSGPENFVASKSVTTTKNANLSSNTETENITIIFKTVKEGNYEISLQNPGASNKHNVIVSNIVLKKGITINEDEKYDATLDGTVASVTLNRTIKEGINTLVLPFDLSQEEVEAAFGEDATVYVPTKYADDNITFAVAEGIEANVPCLLDAPEAGDEYKFDNVTLVAADETETEVDGLKMIGVYENGTVENNECNYIVNAKNLYLVDTENVKIKTTRAYFNVPSANEIKTISMSFGGEATGIVNVPAAEAKTGKIYDLQGREVKNPARGIYIIDGQKVLISK